MTDAGLSDAAAVSIMGFFGLAIVIGRIFVGLLIDRFWAPAIAACVLVPAGLACFAFQLPMSYAAFATAAAIVGIATGMEFDLLGFLTARYFGLGHFARIYGRLYAFVALGAGTAPPAFGYAFDATGSYTVPLTLSACLMMLGALCLLALGRYPVIAEAPLPVTDGERCPVRRS
jgi:MFS family permease